MAETDEYYNTQYAEKIGELSKKISDDDLRDVTFEEMAKLRYKPSGDPELDAELNFTKAQLAASKSVRFEPKIEAKTQVPSEGAGPEFGKGTGMGAEDVENRRMTIKQEGDLSWALPAVFRGDNMRSNTAWNTFQSTFSSG